jgi:nitrogen fixation NifU-like protein
MLTISDELYQQVILDHNKNPRNYGKLENPTHSALGHNPLCGDRIEVNLSIDPQGVIQEIRFVGEACAICKSSSSLMTTRVKSSSTEQAIALFGQFQQLLQKKLDLQGPHDLQKLTLFAGVWNYPARVKCAALPWHTLLSAIQKTPQVANTESGSLDMAPPAIPLSSQKN